MNPRDRVLAQLKSLPTLPAAVARISALANDDTASARDWEMAIKPDPALTANLLRLANSSFFGCRGQIESVRHAITLLGTKRVLDAAIGAGFAKVIPTQIPGYGLSAPVFWRHSTAVAILSERLAARLAGNAPALAFTSGLLHDIGKLATGVVLAERCDEVLRRVRAGGHAFVAAEADVLGLDHAEVGGLVTETWNLPAAVCHSARWHHSPDAAPDSQQLVDLVHVADCLAHSLGFGADIGELSREFMQGALDRLGGTVRVLDEVASEAFEYAETMGATIVGTGGEDEWPTTP